MATLSPATLTNQKLDKRPLLNPAEFEIPEYRLQFHGDHGFAGKYAGVATVTV